MEAQSPWCTRRVGYKEIVRQEAVDQRACWDCSNDCFSLYLARDTIITRYICHNLWGSNDTITGSPCHLFRLHVPANRMTFALLEVRIAPVPPGVERGLCGAFLSDHEGDHIDAR